MDIETPDDTEPRKTAADEHYFTRHSDPVKPLSAEDEIITEANNVVPVVPLPERRQKKIEQPQRDNDVHDIKQSAVNNLSAEDFHESDL